MAGGKGVRRLSIRGEKLLIEALSRCRKIKLIETEPDILLSWALWHLLQKDYDQALKHAREGLAIVVRCGYRLKQADLHNVLARIYESMGKPVKMREHARQAYDYALCDGPPHCYKAALEEAKARL